ncbi:hypothetical protein D3C73_1414800 [compost metagenome]
MKYNRLTLIYNFPGSGICKITLIRIRCNDIVIWPIIRIRILLGNNPLHDFNMYILNIVGATAGEGCVLKASVRMPGEVCNPLLVRHGYFMEFLLTDGVINQ